MIKKMKVRQDAIYPLIIAGTGAWLVQTKDAGHAMHYSCNIEMKSIEYKYFFRRQQAPFDPAAKEHMMAY
jgi:hypothetical protein